MKIFKHYFNICREKEIWNHITENKNKNSQIGVRNTSKFYNVQTLFHFDMMLLFQIPVSRPQNSYSKENRDNSIIEYVENQQLIDGAVDQAIFENDEHTKQGLDNDESIVLSRPWYFSNGERFPKPAKINKRTNKRLAKLTPFEDVRSDRITNQLMFIPNNYEDIRNEGKLKNILLYNGLGPWNVKQGSYLNFHFHC